LWINKTTHRTYY